MTQHNAPFRIAYLTGVYPLASHTFIQREITALRALGSEVMIASVRRPDPKEIIGPEEQAAQNETYYVLAAAKNPATLLGAHLRLLCRSPKRWFNTLALAQRTHRPGIKGFIWQLFYFLEAGILAQHLYRSGASHIHNHFADSSATVAMLSANLTGLPYSFTMHGPTEFFAPESWHLGEKVARAALVVCISHFARSQVMLFSDPQHWHKLQIVHCGVTPERYTNTPVLDRTDTQFLFVGRLDPVKGLRVLIDAFARARARTPGLSLTIVGDGPDRDWVETQAKAIGDISVLGYQSQDAVASILAQADALVLPSFAEGVPVALMEAMVSNRPVIATRVGGVGELVEHGVSGLMVAPGDVSALANAMVDMASGATTRRQMGKEGRAKVCAEFNIMTEATRLKHLFEKQGDDTPRPISADD